MLRWLAFLMLLLTGASGCAMMDIYDDDGVWVYDSPPVAVTQQQPTCGTNIVPASYNQAETQEPPR